ncbi:hypothetical protein IAR55_004574 [Kwoniella newhampshirensis]|uniref:Uncharacterized protein n=1 Tax=Kwoniella newhampshirensis TaxID=1651941 RepID=A0AAW0Z0V5_9TREE
MPSSSRRYTSSKPSSSSRRYGSSGSRSQSTYAYSPPPAKCTPLRLFKCTCIGPVIQSFLLLLVPFSFCVIMFLAGIWNFPVFVFIQGGQNYHIGSKGVKLNGRDEGIHQYLYNNPLPTPVHSVPALLLVHLILGVVLAGYIFVLIFLGVHAAYTRQSGVWKRDAWAWVTRKQPISARLLTILLTLCVGTLLSLDNAVWGIAQNQKKLDFKPDLLGYFVCIVAFLLCVCWIILQIAATQDRTAYYVEGKKVYM